MRGVFVTGTDTNIGKTAVSAALFHRYRQPIRDGRRGKLWLRYWKPVQTGFPEDDDTATVRALGLCEEWEIHPTGVRLPRPLSPHHSAALCGAQIDIGRTLGLLGSHGGVQSDSARWIVEGAGGVLVPLNARERMIDLIAALRLPALVVARSGLGTINHTLLTLEALRARKIPVAGAVLFGPPNPENRRSIEDFGNILVLGEMPHFAELSAAALATWASRSLDPRGLLEPCFRPSETAGISRSWEYSR
jgi:dethiobiotin synthase